MDSRPGAVTSYERWLGRLPANVVCTTIETKGIIHVVRLSSLRLASGTHYPPGNGNVQEQRAPPNPEPAVRKSGDL